MIDESQLITSLVEAASKGELSELLKTLTERSHSLACIVWEQAPVIGDHSPEEALLFAWAQYATDSIPWRKTDIPVATSLTGLAMRLKEPQQTTNVRDDERAFRDDAWLDRVGPACVFPLTIDENLGAITLYRKRGSEAYSTREIQSYKQVTGLVPLLARSARNKIAFDLLLELDGLLDKHQDDPSVEGGENAVLLKVRERLQQSFRCRTADIYIKDGENGSSVHFHAAGTEDVSTEEIDITKPGLPSYIARTYSTTRPDNAVRVLDLLCIERDLPFLLEQYPGLTEADLFAQRARTVGSAGDLGGRALSYIGVPIVTGETLIGVVSCCAIEGEPNYFSFRELKLLDLVSSRLGRFIAHIREYRSLQREADVWRQLTSAVTSLNQLIDESFVGNLAGKFRQSATLRIQDVLKVEGAEVLWTANDKRGNSVAALSRLLGKETSLSVVLDDNPEIRTLLEGSKVAHTRRLLIAEIACRERMGVLVLGTNRNAFPPHTGSVAKILGQILGLYRFLGSKMEIEREQSRVQTQAFSDLRHQIRSPILQAYRYVKQIPTIYRNDDRLLRSLNAIQGLTKRALSVAECVGFYAELARGSPLQPKLNEWPLSHMRQELVEAAMDFQLLHADKSVAFDVDRSLFDANPNSKIQADVNLFLQCVYNLLENAGKYSFRNTVVRIGGAIHQKQFILTVANTGIPLSVDEAARCSQRGWRSPSVKARLKDSGHGIGLWIVEAIMKTHGGSFYAKPTNALGVTEFSLTVPLEK